MTPNPMFWAIHKQKEDARKRLDKIKKEVFDLESQLPETVTDIGLVEYLTLIHDTLSPEIKQKAYATRTHILADRYLILKDYLVKKLKGE